MKLVDLLTSIYAADSAAAWSNLKQRRKKRSTGQSDPKDLNMSVRQALIKMVNDSDHVLRMHVARAVTTLYFTARGGIHTSRITNKVSEIRSCDRMVLLSCAGQEETFQDIYEVLQLAFTISPDLDDLSAEDESVNRFASRIYTLMMCGCVSPVCERKVVRELVMAVHNIENDLVTKVSGGGGLVVDLVTKVSGGGGLVVDLVTKVSGGGGLVVDLVTKVSGGGGLVVDLVTKVSGGGGLVVDLVTKVSGGGGLVVDLVTKVSEDGCVCVWGGGGGLVVDLVTKVSEDGCVSCV